MLKVKVLEYWFNYLAMESNGHFLGRGRAISEHLRVRMRWAKMAAGFLLEVRTLSKRQRKGPDPVFSHPACAVDLRHLPTNRWSLWFEMEEPEVCVGGVGLGR